MADIMQRVAAFPSVSLGDGTDGATTISGSASLAKAEYDYISLTINSGVTWSLTTAYSPAVIRCLGKVTINGTIDGDTDGGTGGTGQASYPSDPGAGNEGGGTGGGTRTWDNAGGTGPGGCSGGNAVHGLTGSNAYQVHQPQVHGGADGYEVVRPFFTTDNIAQAEEGSGGAGGGNYTGTAGNGGAGGGGIYIIADEIEVSASGVITMDGANATAAGATKAGGGGGGSGGVIVLMARVVTLGGTTNGTATGGAAGGGAGGGANGGVGSVGQCFVYYTQTVSGSASGKFTPAATVTKIAAIQTRRAFHLMNAERYVEYTL